MDDPPWKAVAAALGRERDAVDLMQAHFFGRFSPPSLLPPKERYDVDLEAPVFRYFIDERLASSGVAQLAGPWLPSGGDPYFDREGSWMWGFANPSIAAIGTREIAKLFLADHQAVHEALDRLAVLLEIIGAHRVDVSNDAIGCLCR